MALFFIRLRIEQFKNIVPKNIELNESLVSVIGLRDFCEQSILMEVFGFVFGDEVSQLQNANVAAEFNEFSVRHERVNGQSHYYYGEIFGEMHKLATQAQYYERLLEHGINCGTKSFLISAPLLDPCSSDGLDLRPMLEPALTKSLVLSTDQKEIVQKHLTNQNIKKMWVTIEHIYNVLRQFYLTQQEFQRMLKDGNDKISRDALLLQLAYRRQQIMKANTFLEDEREPIPVGNAQAALCKYPEKMNVHNKAFKEYLLGVIDLSCDKYMSEYMKNRKRIYENKLYALNEIDDNVRMAIIQHYDNDLDLELAEIIAELFNVREEKVYLKNDITIDGEPVDSMEIWENRLHTMSKYLRRHEITAKLTTLKVLKRKTICEQQEWLSCANEPTTMMFSNDVSNRAIDGEVGVHHILDQIDPDIQPEFDEGDYNGAICIRFKYDNVITADDLPMPNIDYVKLHCVDDTLELRAMYSEYFGKMKQKSNQILINIVNHLKKLIENGTKNQIIQKQNENVKKLEIMERELLKAPKQLLNDLWYQKMNGILGTVYRKFPISAEHILWWAREGKFWNNELQSEIQTIKDQQIQIDADHAEMDRIMDDLEYEIQIPIISSMFEEQTEFYNIISDSLTNLNNMRMKQLYEWYLIRNESLMKHIRMELRIDHDDVIVDINSDPNQYIQRISPDLQQFEMDELKTIVIGLQKHWFHISKHPKIFYFDAQDYYEFSKWRMNRCMNDIGKASKLFKKRCRKFQKPFEHFQKTCYDEMEKMGFLMPEFNIIADWPALRYPIEIITYDPKRDEAFRFTKWNNYFTALWMRLFLNLAIEAPVIICDSFDYYLTWEQRNQVYRFLRRVAQERHIQIVLMSCKSVDIERNDNVHLMWHTNVTRDQIEMADVSDLVQVEELEYMEGVEEFEDEDDDL